LSSLEGVGLLFPWNDNIRGTLHFLRPQQAGRSDARQVLTGKVPFYDVKMDAVIMRIVRGIRPERPHLSHAIGFTDPVWTIVEGCWKEHYPLRPDVPTVVRCLAAAAAQWTPTPPLNDDPWVADESNIFTTITLYGTPENTRTSGEHPQVSTTQKIALGLTTQSRFCYPACRESRRR
jgi:hypothetical protein